MKPPNLIPGAVWFTLLAILMAPVALGALSGGTVGLAYVTSNSMEPLLKVGEGFLVWPSRNPSVGDIIVFRPLVLKADRVVHRIVAVAPEGYITRGDNTSASDQAAGEPPVGPDRIIGQAVVWDGRPVRLPYVGLLSRQMRQVLGQNLILVLASMVGMSLVLMAWGYVKPARDRPSRVRWRVGHVYMAAAGTGVLAVLMTMLLGSGAHSFEYLATQNPSTGLNHVPLGKEGVIRVEVVNPGLVPIHQFIAALPPARIITAPELLLPLSSAPAEVRIPPHGKPGWYRSYVSVYQYPPLLPRSILAWLHGRSPYLAMGSSLAVLLAALWLVSLTIETRVPLSGQRDSPVITRFMRVFQASCGRRQR